MTLLSVHGKEYQSRMEAQGYTFATHSGYIGDTCACGGACQREGDDTMRQMHRTGPVEGFTEDPAAAAMFVPTIHAHGERPAVIAQPRPTASLGKAEFSSNGGSDPAAEAMFVPAGPREAKR